MSDNNENQAPVNVTDETTTTASSTDENPSHGRRQFFTGMATAVGAGIILGAAESASGAEKSAAEVRSRILSRIQNDLKRSQSEMVFGYDKPDNDTPHGRYVKAE